MRPLREIEDLANAQGLAVLGGFEPNPEDKAPAGCMALLMLGPSVDFWEKFQAAPEFTQQPTDPLDHWSKRVIGALASQLGAEAHFPFGGPPYAPFISWAVRTGRAAPSPVGLLAHAEHGLMVSYRGALAFAEPIELPAPLPHPCDTCTSKPCLTACPAGVMGESGYDVPGCHAFLERPEGKDCLQAGCKVRRACPVDGAKRSSAQSGFHMAAFHSS